MHEDSVHNAIARLFSRFLALVVFRRGFFLHVEREIFELSYEHTRHTWLISHPAHLSLILLMPRSFRLCLPHILQA